MQNFVQHGDTISATAPYDVASGAGALVGIAFGVAVATAASGATVQLQRTGVHTLAKATGAAWVAWTTRLYWNNSNKNVTTLSTGNTLIGVAAAAAASGATTGSILLQPNFAA
ncbi:MAG: DUF2190 family protein [Sneathiellaceae bacterium]